MNGQINVMWSIEHYICQMDPPPPGRSDTGVNITYYTPAAMHLSRPETA